jgi:hypothetical protein
MEAIWSDRVGKWNREALQKQADRTAEVKGNEDLHSEQAVEFHQ